MQTPTYLAASVMCRYSWSLGIKIPSIWVPGNRPRLRQYPTKLGHKMEVAQLHGSRRQRPQETATRRGAAPTRSRPHDSSKNTRWIGQSTSNPAEFLGGAGNWCGSRGRAWGLVDYWRWWAIVVAAAPPPHFSMEGWKRWRQSLPRRCRNKRVSALGRAQERRPPSGTCVWASGWLRLADPLPCD
jgi:hypothetical protein